VEWVWRRIDVLIAAVFVAVSAVAASQGHVFMAQYEERLARDLAQARARVDEIETGLRYKLMSETVRAELAASAQARFDQVDVAHTAIAGAGLLKPIALARHRTPELIAETERGFVPRMPRAAGAILATVLGALLGFLAYEIVKLPVTVLTRPRQRKFRRRS
jgi:hypothetical protein